MDAIQKAGYDDTVMVIVTNTMMQKDVQRLVDGPVNHGADVIGVQFNQDEEK